MIPEASIIFVFCKKKTDFIMESVLGLVKHVVSLGSAVVTAKVGKEVGDFFIAQ